MLVYRLENGEGLGAYRVFQYAEIDYGSEPSWIEFMVDSEYEFGKGNDPWPSPVDDALGQLRSEEHCGFATENQLFSWFFSVYPERVLKDIALMEEAGMRVRKFRVHDSYVRHGMRQSVFPRHRTDVFSVDEESPTDFYLRYLIENNLTGVL